MVRTQIQLEEGQVRRLRAIARRERISLAELIRRCVDAALEATSPGLDERYDVAGQMVGALHDREGRTDVAERHDDHLDEAYE